MVSGLQTLRQLGFIFAKEEKAEVHTELPAFAIANANVNLAYA